MRTGVVEHAVEGEGHLLIRFWLGGQEPSLVQHVDLQCVDLLLQFRLELTLEVAQARLGGEDILEARAAPERSSVVWMPQHAQHLVTGDVPLSPVDAQQVHTDRMKGHLSLG